MLEVLRWKLKPYILGYPLANRHLLPDWIGIVENFNTIPPDSLILIDEAYLLYHARKSNVKKATDEMTNALGLARQRGHSIIFITHEARFIDKNIVSYANAFIIKKPGLMDTRFERPELRNVITKAREFFNGIEGDKRRWCYVWSPEKEFEEELDAELPSCWSDEISRAYARGITASGNTYDPFISKREKKQKAGELRDKGMSYGKIAKILGVSKSTIINWVLHEK